MTHLPQYRAKPILPMRSYAPDPIRLVLPVCAMLSGAIVGALIALLIGPHVIELALPIFGLCIGALFRPSN